MTLPIHGQRVNDDLNTNRDRRRSRAARGEHSLAHLASSDIRYSRNFFKYALSFIPTADAPIIARSGLCVFYAQSTNWP